jgi:uncharacterized SAM-binding protein YcdF (DUF218 family)
VFHALIWTFDVFANPVTWILVSVLVGTLCSPRPWARALVAAAGGLLLLLSLQPVSNALLRGVETRVPSTIKSGTTYDAVILLGGAVDHDPTQSTGIPSYDDDVDRIFVVLDLLREDRARDVIVTGGAVGVGDEVVEARVIGKLLESFGVAASRIVLAEASRNTSEDAVETRRIVRERGYRSLVLVTSARHMPRAVDRFRAVELSVDTLAADHRSFGSNVHASYIPRADHLADSADVIRESIGAFLQRLAD